MPQAPGKAPRPRLLQLLLLLAGLGALRPGAASLHPLPPSLYDLPSMSLCPHAASHKDTALDSGSTVTQ